VKSWYWTAAGTTAGHLKEKGERDHA